jgi:8-oxo-dGTP pyrophosphatase MutT (NUDIX family)
VEPRDAATVLILRSTDASPLEVFVQHRRTSMAFAGGALAFPGGGVEAFDSVPVTESWADRLGAPVAQAGGVAAAAIREITEETGVRLTVTELGLWDAWTTPEFMPKRYRTWFFTALLPEGQEAQDTSTEASQVAWVRPAEAIERAVAGEWSLLPPTFVSLARLARFESAADVMAATVDASVEMFTPVTPGDVPGWADEAGIVWTDELWGRRS